MQKKGMSKLMGMDYTIMYHMVKENVVADALSRREEKGECKLITIVVPK